MSYITKSMTIIITLSSMSTITHQINPFTPYDPLKVHLKKQGNITGVVTRLKNRNLPFVEVYKGIPYAAPPVDKFRFMPPSSPIQPLNDVGYGYHFGAVCPQKFPDESMMTDERKRYFRKLKQYLMHQSEDCLYLNIYAPHQESKGHPRAYPVIVFIHGESFEWNSGNPYDGSVLAAYGQVVVVTLNFRLGILGFLKVGAEDTTNQSNFGLVDQVAALLWIEANINEFGGDPHNVTLMGHGTGAVCASLLTISPMATYQSTKLFHRVILMSGTALADWALVKEPLEVSEQIAKSLNCPLRDNFADCLRKKRLNEIMDVVTATDPYKITFGPIVDKLVIPNDPKKSMKQQRGIFRRLEFIYGVTEMESINLPLGPTFIHGLMESERDEELIKYMRVRCERKSEYCLSETKARYNYESILRDQDRYRNSMGYEPDKARLARDELLDILSDARTVAPIIQTGLYHSDVNFQSYFYVFTHKTHSKGYIRNRTYNGDELPYIFGAPLDASKSHFLDVSYTEEEKRLSMAMMRYFSNFAYTGNPMMPNPIYLDDDYSICHDKDWHEFNRENQTYIKFDTSICQGKFYRKEQVEYWNEVFPTFTGLPDKVHKLLYEPSQPADIIIPAPATEFDNTSLTNVALILGTLFLLFAVILLLFLYYKWINIKKNEPEHATDENNIEEANEHHAENYCWISKLNLSKLFFKSIDETYDEVDMDLKNGSAGKLTRAMSNSTIDAHAKVRNWIAKEIAIKYSPKGEQKSSTRKEKVDKTRMDPIEFPVEIDLDKCPTRPVSSNEETFNAKSLLIKTASIDRSNHRRRPDKVSVAIDATPSGRGPSVLAQKPIELTKSFEFPKTSPTPLRRSMTVDDFSTQNPNRPFNVELSKSSTSINLKNIETEPRLIRIEHGHSKSDPVQDLDYSAVKKLKTFDPNNDINVTSRSENEEQPPPLSPEEALKTIKRRNFPKVLPDHPGRMAFINKRRSMPVHNVHLPYMDINQYSNSEPYSPSGRGIIRFPPIPPPRISTLIKQISSPQAICHSEPTLAEEPPASPEPEVTCNNLYVGPLIPRTNQTNSREKLTTSQKCLKNENRPLPKTIVTANRNNPIKRTDPKIIVKPTINRNEKSVAKHIPRVVVPDNKPEIHAKPNIVQKNRDNDIMKYGKVKKSNIPTLVKNSNLNLDKESSSSESNSPSSENSDTGTVVKKT